ncbi:hypothetical protein AVEN_61047-1 [Araneus ventricosus]|uniref:Uncharacterized protein n=1 Tax=Araneus ventricosus TaxID=182803 RepID=A0A4Y2DXY5_ARAVE|nr:hypothetical protein AVEN_61047-1 [Araneus ventricosus]
MESFGGARIAGRCVSDDAEFGQSSRVIFEKNPIRHLTLLVILPDSPLYISFKSKTKTGECWGTSNYIKNKTDVIIYSRSAKYNTKHFLQSLSVRTIKELYLGD